MARPRKPTNVLELNGAFKHNPDRGAARESEPEAVGDVGEPAENLNAHQKACWHDLVNRCHAGVLCAADAPFMEYAAKVWSQIRLAEEIDPKLGIRFETICARLGMTPADRSKVQVVKPKENENPFAKFKPAG
jgi:hypothetical protein